MAKKLKAALLGFGGMGHFHATQYKDQPDCTLIAICDVDRKKFEKLSADINLGNSGEADLASVHQYLSYEEMIRNEKPDLIDICLPCHLHAEYAVRAMKEGFHVISEKPMARTLAQADRMIRVSRETGKQLMIAQCLRFEKTFNALKQAYDSRKYGRLLRMDLRRCSGPAGTKTSWYRDVKCSGGALLDLHLHDTDFVNYVLGTPDAVQTFGVTRVSGGIDDLMSTYFFADGPIVNAEASWCRAEWHTSSVMVFEKATLELEGTRVKISRTDKPLEVLDCSGKNGYWSEIAYFVDCILKNRKPEQCLPESTRESIRIALAEERSALRGRKISLK